ncbi:MAG: hypothetical protein H7Y15_09760 [Pseudonocardia sp.]|nr:hypothetical protein [Pseudonocardia sp.]
MVRLGAAVVALAVAALVVAVVGFGPVALVVGAPLLMATVLTLVVLRLSQAPRRRLSERRSARWEHETPEQGGLMSGFFEVPTAPR